MTALLILYALAFLAFVFGLADWPPLSATRCLCLGLALLTLAKLIGG